VGEQQRKDAERGFLEARQAVESARVTREDVATALLAPLSRVLAASD
jgi:hypothetical protein